LVHTIWISIYMGKKMYLTGYKMISNIETGTGFIASKEGEILPEYYLFSHLTDSEGKSLDLLGIKLIDAKGQYEFGRGKGIFRVSDIRGRTPEEVYAELRGPGDAGDRVIIELRTEKNPKIFTPEGHYNIVEDRWHWPYTGTGFISTKNGEILPEYYLYNGLKNKQGELLEISAIKIKTADGDVWEIGW